jgi:hypothetical protein
VLQILGKPVDFERPRNCFLEDLVMPWAASSAAWGAVIAVFDNSKARRNVRHCRNADHSVFANALLD